MTATLMIQGTASNVGKSLLVAGFCRVFARRGLAVRPFKPQTLSNNAAVTADGGEIGRAQALQATACGVAPSVHMNPVLLKPEAGMRVQVIVQGQRLTTSLSGADPARKPSLMAPVLDSFRRVRAGADLVLVEGAGAASEINLRAGDIANMGFAQAARVPVLLTGDIACGGVIAQIVGTRAVLDPADAALVKGFVVNRFHGDTRLFEDGYRTIVQRSGWPGLGVVPWFADARRLPAEDAADLRRIASGGSFRIAVPELPRIANFDDLDPLMAEPGLRVDLIAPGRPLPVEADLILIPGSKATIADLAAFRAEGWDIDLAAALRRGARVIGLCGGYQMLGRSIADPEGIEGTAGTVPGLGLMQIDTVMTREKRVTQVSGRHIASGCAVRGYEIHIGQSIGPDRARPLFDLDGRMEGAICTDGRVMGSYLHGLFAADDFRAAFLTSLGAEAGGVAYDAGIEAALDALADHLEAHVDCDALLRIAHEGVSP